ncbi:protein ARABIDOPSIS THALIANA ANTHER 7 [Ricinus communis]|uniref:Nonspecific lipid-transfer protein 3, putative n=1 Tax=Ricinus communis TaxID=3988 RepID=B9RVV9_RICCO|nr:protein ARABIDOPSIS THALIANA ANTHER 7 [Ricinus communis]EEF44396.1 Nonspecific lipid-transfer protein 3 precursor, putative [Ricinus communis]|eukprot:XP_002517878.1 protein ARABIDOPSIS THALIANA ANTHER 7 [Ricinus communis]
MTRLIAFLTVILLVSGSAMPQQIQDFIDCLNVIIYFSSCIGYIDGHVREPTWGCCMGVHELNRLVKQDRDAQKICQCIELIAAVDDPPFVLANIDALPSKCQTHLSFPISVKKNCSEVQ